MDTPLSAVNMTLSLSLLSSSMAFASSRVILGLGGCVFLRICLISPRSSSAFPFSSCRHAFSICEMYSLTGGSLVVIAKFGPRASAFSCASVRGVLDRLCTHLVLLLLLLLLLWMWATVVVIAASVVSLVCLVSPVILVPLMFSPSLPLDCLSGHLFFPIISQISLFVSPWFSDVFFL